MARWKARVELLLSVIELLFLSLAAEALQGKMCQNSLPPGGGGHLEPRFQREGVARLPIYWYQSKGNWLCYNYATDSFYIINFAADFSSFIVKIVQKMTNLGTLSVIELLFLFLADETLQGKMCQNLLPSGGVGHLELRFQGEGVVPPANILIPLERQLIALQLCRWHLLYNETLQQTSRHVLPKLSKRQQI